MPYDESIEPVANEDEAAQHAMQVAEEEEEEQMLLSRFSGEVDVREWCVGFRCVFSLALNTSTESCHCWLDFNHIFSVNFVVQCLLFADCFNIGTIIPNSQ